MSDQSDINELKRKGKDKNIILTTQLFNTFKISPQYVSDTKLPFVIKIDFIYESFLFSQVSFKLKIGSKWIKKKRYVVQSVSALRGWEGKTLKWILEETDVLIHPKLFLYLNENYIIK